MDSFVARQPIFDRTSTVRAYELLFRSGPRNAYDSTDPDAASSKVIADSMFLPSLARLTAGKLAFINVTRNILMDHLVELLPPATTVLEILETVEPDDPLLDACRDLRRRGYRLALDDFRATPERMALLEIADMVKIDVLATAHADRAALARQMKSAGITLLAEKIETWEMYEETLALGYEFFQGYYFARPTVITGRDIPAFKLSYLQILREIHRPELELDALEAVIGREVGLTYKLLRYLNASFFGWSGSVSSLHHALFLLGERDVRKWASVIVLGSIAPEKPDELVSQTLLRARFCEQLALHTSLSRRSSDLFLVGMFSLMDAILDQPLAEVIGLIPLPDDVRAALLERHGPMGDLLSIIEAYGRGEWGALEVPCARLGINPIALPLVYSDAVEWSGSWPAIGERRKAA